MERFSRLPNDRVLPMGDMSSGHDGEVSDCKSDDDDVDGVLNLAGGIFEVHVVIVCNSPLCSLSDLGVRCDDVVGVAVRFKFKQFSALVLANF